MTIDTNTVVSMSEANQNFSRVARIVDQFGRAIVFKNNSPKYIVLDFSIAEQTENLNCGTVSETNAYTSASDEEVFTASKKLMEKYDTAYKELAK